MDRNGGKLRVYGRCSFRDAGRTGRGEETRLRRYRKSLFGCSPCRAAPECRKTAHRAGGRRAHFRYLKLLLTHTHTRSTVQTQHARLPMYSQPLRRGL